MVEKKRENSGRYSRSVDDAEVLAAVRAHDPAATSEIAEEVGISRQGADRRLRVLRDSGDVSSKKIGASLVWFMPRDASNTSESSPPDDDTQPPRDGRGSPETPPEGERWGSGRDQGNASESGEGDHDSLREGLRDALAGSGNRLERRVDAILTMYDHLREHGEATNDQLQELIDPDAVNYADEASLWSNMVKGKDTLRSLPGVVKPAEGTDSPWRYKGSGD